MRERSSRSDALELAIELMMDFATRTGVSGHRPPERYLWTDAFAVCNCLGLGQHTGEDRYNQLAWKIIEQVHAVLGHHRQDDPRSGWLDSANEDHPTRGGLRIGKDLSERRAGEPLDPRREWNRDGQYFHYLTKWMHALDVVSRHTAKPEPNRWARELAQAAHDGFTYTADGQTRMYWKMSIDLSRPLVPSMGHHDPLDGLITDVQVEHPRNHPTDDPDLSDEIAEMVRICKGRDWVTDDPLGLGGLMADAYRIQQLAHHGHFRHTGLLHDVLDAAVSGLAGYRRQAEIDLPANHRLGFRELGLSIGFHAIERMQTALKRDPKPFSDDDGLMRKVDAILEHGPFGAAIEQFWREPRHRQTRTWQSHRDINDVMLATSLVPGGYLDLSPATA